MGKIFAIGDIHGCVSPLDKLLAKLEIDAKNDTLLFIGDYIDRGPDSRGVVDRILDIRGNLKNVVCLRGNHEQMFLNFYLEGRDEDLFMYNGGISTLISYGLAGEGKKDAKMPESHLEFYSTLRPYYITDDYIFVHAGLRPGIPLDRQDPDDMLWMRHEFIKSTYDFGKIVVFGHTTISFSTPLIDKRKIGLDTGAVYGGKLTCVELPETKIYQV